MTPTRMAARPTIRTTRADAGPAPQNRTFTQEQFRVGCVPPISSRHLAFWRQLERVGQPGERTRRRAHGILRVLAESQFRDCRGVAFNPRQAEAFRLFGFEPVSAYGGSLKQPVRCPETLRLQHCTKVRISNYAPNFSASGSLPPLSH